MRITSALLIVSILVSGCATMGHKMTHLEEGMTKEEVIDELGRPDGFQRAGEHEAIEYSNRLMSGWSWDRADYYVILENEQVVQYGAGEVREREPNVLVLVPLRSP